MIENVEEFGAEVQVLIPEDCNFLPSERSMLKYFGARTMPTPASPKLPSGGMTNAVSSSQ